MVKCNIGDRPYEIELEEEERDAILRYAELCKCSADEVISGMFADLMERIDEVELCMRSIEDYEATGVSVPIEEVAKRQHRGSQINRWATSRAL